MKLPDYIKVGPLTYRVTEDQAEWNAVEHQLKRTGDFGHTMNLTAIIYINPGSAENVKKLTLVHEALHAFNAAVMGAPSWKNMMFAPDNEHDAEEAMVRAWESSILMLILDNPGLVQYLQE